MSVFFFFFVRIWQFPFFFCAHLFGYLMIKTTTRWCVSLGYQIAPTKSFLVCAGAEVEGREGGEEKKKCKMNLSLAVLSL